MDLIKQYLTQCIVAAANNLRLNTEKIEIVALIREFIYKTEDIEKSLREMKKVTELSTFAIRLNEIYNYIAKSKIDFLKISDKFKEHSHYLVRDLNVLLDRISPQNFSIVIHRIEEENSENVHINSCEKTIANVQFIEDNSSKQIPVEEKIEEKSEAIQSGEIVNDDSAANISDKENDFLFEDFEEKIITPIKELDSLLKNLSSENMDLKEMQKYYELMVNHCELARKVGFGIIANMHEVFAGGLKLLMDGTLEPQKEVLESMRACLIVIVAVVRGKEVDITGYLNRAEEFGNYIFNM